MKKITSLCALLCCVAMMSAQDITSDVQKELQADANSRTQATLVSMEDLVERNLTTPLSETTLSDVEQSMLRSYISQQNRSPEADFIPTAGATETFNVAVGDFFFDTGGPGGTGTDGDPGNYVNCACTTLTTLTGADEIVFNAFHVFATFDWLKIYDGTDTTGTVLYDNDSGGINDGDQTLADMIASNGCANFESTTGSFTFEFFATGVVNREGWEVEVITPAGGCGGGGGTCDGVLANYINDDAAGNGVPSQDFEAANDAFDAEAADDFIVPGLGSATICQVDLIGTGSALGDPNSTVTLRIYEDDAGLPGTEIFSETFDGTDVDDGSGDFSIQPTGPSLPSGGHYWLSVQISMDFGVGGQWFWSTATDGNDDAYKWRNMGDGFGTGCTDWTDGQVCGVGGGTGPDLLMDISFNQDPNDLCEDAFPIFCGDVISGSTSDATIDTGVALDCVNDGGGPSPVTISAPGVWYIYDDNDGLAKNVNLSTCNDANFDTKISVYTGDCTDLSCFTAVDDAAGCAGFTTELDFISDGNTTYYILVHGFGAATGDFNLTMTCTILPPPNDMIANSIDVDEIGTPYTDPFVAMMAATTEAGNPTDCIIDGANGVWYNLVAEGNGTGTAEVVSPAGTTAVIWFTAPDESAVETDLTLVPGGDNQCLPSTSSTINTVQGQAYYIFVVNTDGPTDINIDGVNLGVDDTVIVGFSYQPNPVNNTLELNSKELIEEVQIFNILGQRVVDLDVNATNSMIDVSGLQTGTYIMKASVNGQIGTYKIIKE